MAELLGVVSGAVSLAAFTGQLAQSAASLHAFIHDIKDAPDDLRRIANELQIIQLVLGNVPSTFTGQDTDLTLALAHCQSCLDELVAFKNKVDPAPHANQHQRLWSQCKFAAKRSHLAKYLGNLQRANLLLQQVCSLRIKDEQEVHTGLLQTHQASLASVLSMQTASSDVILATKTVVDEIKASSIDQEVFAAHVNQVANETRKMVGGLVDEMHQMSERANSASQTTQKLL